MSNFPTLDGLNNIDVDNGNLTNITCETFIATTSAQVPTMIAGDNSTNVANTEFVTDALSTATANLVTLDTTQTLTTGVKTFTNLPQSSATVSNNADLTNKKYVDDNFINIIGDQTLTTGIKTFTVLFEFVFVVVFFFVFVVCSSRVRVRVGVGAGVSECECECVSVSVSVNECECECECECE